MLSAIRAFNKGAMQKTKTYKSLGVAALLLPAAATIHHASAAVLIQTQNFSFVPNGSQTLTFAKFDSSLGTLQSVIVTVGYTKSGGSLSVDNDSENSGNIDLSHSISGNLTVASGGVSLLNSEFSTIGLNLNAVNTSTSIIGPTSGDPIDEFNATGDVDFVRFDPSPITVTDSGTINSIFQNSYISNPESNIFSLIFEALQSTGATGLGGLQQSFVVSDVEGYVTVTYNYDEVTSVVPEPSSTLALGALLGFGLMTRVRRR